MGLNLLPPAVNAVGASRHRGSFGALSLRADGGEVPCLLVRAPGGSLHNPGSSNAKLQSLNFNYAQPGQAQHLEDFFM